jgi:hypothetical protein
MKIEDRGSRIERHYLLSSILYLPSSPFSPPEMLSFKIKGAYGPADPDFLAP